MEERKIKSETVREYNGIKVRSIVLDTPEERKKEIIKDVIDICVKSQMRRLREQKK